MARLGSGSYGQVTLCRECAVKQTDMFDSNDDVFDENVVEATIAATLRDAPKPNLIRVHSVEVDTEGIIYTRMEYGPQTFDEHICSLTVKDRTDQSTHFVWRIREGLRSLHRMGLVHGDLKLTNVMIVGHDARQQVILRLIDFGVTRTLMNRAGPSVQKVDCGTFQYAAPESLASPQIPTVGWDAWSLGCIIHQLIQGRDLVEMPQECEQDPHAYAAFHADAAKLTAHERFGSCPSGVPPDLFQHMQDLLEYDPSLRASLDHDGTYTAELQDPQRLHPDLKDERDETISWFYQTYWPQRAFIPLAINLMDRYCDVAGWPASVVVLQSCMTLANTMLMPDTGHLQPTKPDKKAVMHVTRTLEFRLYADTLLSLLYVFRRPPFVDHERVQRALCISTSAWEGVHAYEADTVGTCQY